ncbi:hypothetical protein ACS6F6_06445 [Enterobacter hormaechei subsp. steigerwaltii]|uniref:hypothetical protein n=1 Tax=Enterobacter hormaechei TaxID=158836 RepID=UPI003F42E0F3
MSNIDKQALNQEKIEWLNKLADMEYCKSNPGHWLMSLKDTNMLAKLALRSVALLDELAFLDKRNAELNSTLERWAVDRAQSASELDDAQKRIAELSALQGKPIAWESTTPVYIKFITDERYQRLRPGYKKWYKPYRCSQCAATGKGEAS